MTVTYFSGQVERVIYEDPGKSFYILRMCLDPPEDSITDPNSFESLMSPTPQLETIVKGNIGGLAIRVGSWFGFEGKWVRDQKHGMQLQITRAPCLPGGKWSVETAERMLLTHNVDGFLVHALSSFFKEDLLTALDNKELLKTCPGIDAVSAAMISNKWISIQAYFSSMKFLQDLGISKEKIKSVWGHFGDSAEEILAKDPWRLIEIDGITFEQADKVALGQGLDVNCFERKRASVFYALKQNKTSGHLFARTGTLMREAQHFSPSLTQNEVANSLRSLKELGLVVLDNKTIPGEVAVYETWFEMVESRSASLLRTRQQVASRGVKERVHALSMFTGSFVDTDPQSVALSAISEWEGSSGVELSEQQKQGVCNALFEPVSLITGLPGTGKSTSIKAVVEILSLVVSNILCVAPTGIAAKRLGRLTGQDAKTIHRAFSAKKIGDDGNEDREETYKGVLATGQALVQSKASSEWEYHEGNPYPAEVIIVDESSMLDQNLLYRLLCATRPSSRLVFVGDVAQLPSVGPGNVFRDLVDSGLFPTVRLTEIYRQEGTSEIVFAAHDIFQGKTPSPEKYQRDFIFYHCGTDEDVLASIKNRVQLLYDKEEDFQVLSPRHMGTIGVTNLNIHLREMINPSQPSLPEMKVGKEILRQGDRVMIVRNNYMLGIYNGDLGKIHKVDRSTRRVIVKIYDVIDRYIDFNLVQVRNHLRLAYSCTVHKFQGLEIDNIIMPITRSLGRQLLRNLLYTAVTRAKKKVFLYGSLEALEKAVSNDKSQYRNSRFVPKMEQWIPKEESPEVSSSTLVERMSQTIDQMMEKELF